MGSRAFHIVGWDVPTRLLKLEILAGVWPSHDGWYVSQHPGDLSPLGYER